MTYKFEEWLAAQQQREGLIGDFARLPRMQNVEPQGLKRRKVDEHKNWADVVIQIADPAITAIFNRAWQEFLVEKQAAADAAESV